VKEHFKKYKTVYISVGVGLVCAGVTVLIMRKLPSCAVKGISDGFTVTASDGFTVTGENLVSNFINTG
jgi:hypothetical protein